MFSLSLPKVFLRLPMQMMWWFSFCIFSSGNFQCNIGVGCIKSICQNKRNPMVCSKPWTSISFSLWWCFPEFHKGYSSEKGKEVSVSSFWDYRFKWSDSFCIFHGNIQYNIGIWYIKSMCQNKSNPVVWSKPWNSISVFSIAIFAGFLKNIHHRKVQEMPMNFVYPANLLN